MNDLKLLKVGAEIYIGKEKNENGIYTGCCLVRYQMTPQGMQVGLMPPFAPFSDKMQDISEDHVVCVDNAPEDMAGAYIQTTTGIQIAPANVPGLKLV